MYWAKYWVWGIYIVCYFICPELTKGLNTGFYTNIVFVNFVSSPINANSGTHSHTLLVDGHSDSFGTASKRSSSYLCIIFCLIAFVSLLLNYWLVWCAFPCSTRYLLYNYRSWQYISIDCEIVYNLKNVHEYRLLASYT